jgi:hypothetical protein
MSRDEWIERYATKFLESECSPEEALCAAAATHDRRGHQFYSLLSPDSPESFAEADMACRETDDRFYDFSYNWLWSNGYRLALESPEEAPAGMLRRGLAEFFTHYPELESLI